MPDAAPESRLQAYRERIERVLEASLPGARDETDTLHRAMSYAVLGGGKRMRPLLAYGAADALSLPHERADAVACAVELIHAYSLIHDDLPAMDDDELRRGRPTCHIAFDEATAILAGDALQALAFAVLAQSGSGVNAPAAVAQIQELSYACGAFGMAGGQALDLTAVGRHTTPAQLETMHVMKTGALIRATLRMTARLQPALAQARLEQLTEYGHYVGLAFQVHDDILDVHANTETLGKTAGRDQARGKPTYPSVLGLESARRHAHNLVEQALSAVRDWDGKAEMLRYLARYAIQRNS